MGIFEMERKFANFDTERVARMELMSIAIHTSPRGSIERVQERAVRNQRVVVVGVRGLSVPGSSDWTRYHSARTSTFGDNDENPETKSLVDVQG